LLFCAHLAQRRCTLQLRSQIDDEPGVLGSRARWGRVQRRVTKSSLGLTDAVLRFENYFRRDEIECVPKALLEGLRADA
jgi:hypothetical protein